MSEAEESARGEKVPLRKRVRRGARAWWHSYLAIGGMGPQARHMDEVAGMYKYMPGHSEGVSHPEVLFAYSLVYVFAAVVTGGAMAIFLGAKDVSVRQCFALSLVPIAYFHLVYRGLRRQHFFMAVTISMWPITVFLTRAVIRAYRRKVVVEVMEQ